MQETPTLQQDQVVNQKILQAQRDSVLLQSIIDKVSAALNKGLQNGQENSDYSGDKEENKEFKTRLKYVQRRCDQAAKQKQQLQQKLLEQLEMDQSNFVQEIRIAQGYYRGKFEDVVQDLQQASFHRKTVVESHVIGYNNREEERMSLPIEIEERINTVKRRIQIHSQQLQDLRTDIVTQSYETFPWDNCVDHITDIHMQDMESQYQMLDEEVKEQKRLAQHKLKLLQNQSQKQEGKREELQTFFTHKVDQIKQKLKSVQTRIKKEANRLDLRLYVSGSRITRYPSSEYQLEQ
eukprot:TRINITY_DN64951_c0_g1_i1.p1 TRINITY_DN64951_c0_g1~~TRINITY_DN64951_c0_g1_i1.p1  ORF type:complete len:293 (-),score=43.52 TRINITY_DN64951_c0_g1_i1:118-996(-)